MDDIKIDNLTDALALVSLAIPPVVKNRMADRGRGGRYSYADLAAVVEAVKAGCRQVREEAGVVVSFGQSLEQTEGGVVLRTTLRGCGEERSWDLPLDAFRTEFRLGGFQTVTADGEIRQGALGIQEVGSLLTYLRRYALLLTFGVATEEDDDAQQVQGRTANAVPPRPTPRPEPRPEPRPAAPQANNRSEQVKRLFEQHGIADQAEQRQLLADVSAILELPTGQLLGERTEAQFAAIVQTLETVLSEGGEE